MLKTNFDIFMRILYACNGCEDDFNPLLLVPLEWSSLRIRIDVAHKKQIHQHFVEMDQHKSMA